MLREDQKLQRNLHTIAKLHRQIISQVESYPQGGNTDVAREDIGEYVVVKRWGILDGVLSQIEPMRGTGNPSIEVTRWKESIAADDDPNKDLEFQISIGIHTDRPTEQQVKRLLDKGEITEFYLGTHYWLNPQDGSYSKIVDLPLQVKDDRKPAYFSQDDDTKGVMGVIDFSETVRLVGALSSLSSRL